MKVHVRRVFATLCSLGLVVLAAAGCGSSNTNDTKSVAPPAPAALQTADGAVKVTLGEWNVLPSAVRAKAGKIKFTAVNSGTTEHEMIVIRTDKAADHLGAGARIPEAGSIGEISEFGAGKSVTKTLNLKPGHYALVCNIAGHYQQGMRTDFEVL